MKPNRSFLWVAVFALLLAAGIGACFLETDIDERNQEIPNPEGDAFRFETDDVGAVKEIDETGHQTGRLGQQIDLDRDGKGDEFFQIPYPKVGIIGLGFDPETGMANAAKTLGMMNIVPGTTHYALPLAPLTSWIKADDVERVNRGKAKDDYDYAYWHDPVTDATVSGILTGKSERMIWQARSFGLAAVEGSVKSPAADDDTGDDDTGDDDTGDDDTGDDDTGDDDTGDDDTGDDDTQPEEVLTCEVYEDVCDREQDCEMFAGGWTERDCREWMANAWRTTELRKFMNCVVQDCLPLDRCGDYEQCRKTCWEEKTFDQFGCDATHGVEIVDTFYLQDNGSRAGRRLGGGFTVSQDAKIGIYFQYRDVEGNLTGGTLNVSFDGGPFEVVGELPDGLGRNSFESGMAIGFSLANPLPVGEHTFQAYIEDACGKSGNTVSGGFKVVSDDRDTLDPNNEEFNGLLGINAVEYYDTVIDKFNEDRGVLAEPALPPELFYDISFVDVGLLQCYIWLIQSGADQSDFTFQQIQFAILSTTATDSGTKYDPLDDSQAAIFYFDEALTPGVLLIWGDKGWNLFYQGPYGNADTNFIRGDWADYEIRIPTAPVLEVPERYKGCKDNCEYWVDFIYREPETPAGETEPDWHTGMNATLKGPNGDTLSAKEAYDLCRQYSANGYWDCVLSCAKREEDDAFDLQRDPVPNKPDANRRCLTGTDCLEKCQWDNVQADYCDVAEPLALKVKVEVPPRCQADSRHVKRLQNENGALKVGVYVQGAGLIPGAYVTFDPSKLVPEGDNWVAYFTIPLPYGDTIPNSFFNVNKISDAQVQALPAIVEKTGETGASLWGTSYNEPNELYENNWYHLLIYAYHWVNPTLVGWSLFSVEPPYLQDPWDFGTTRVTVRYGDIRAVEGGELCK